MKPQLGPTFDKNMDWLVSPIDSSRLHEIDMMVAWHGRLMVFAWALMMPIGVLLARFFKITVRQDWPRELDNKFWWRGHLWCQAAAAVATVFGLIAVWAFSNVAIPVWSNISKHGVMGLVVFFLCIIQFLLGCFRGTKGGPTDLRSDGTMHGDHYNMTPRRRAFEYLHKSIGYITILITVPAIISGLWLVNAPKWMWLVIIVWWALYGLIFVSLQRWKMAVDTYQAIWGSDPDLPGNQVKPIGWGISRRK